MIPRDAIQDAEATLAGFGPAAASRHDGLGTYLEVSGQALGVLGARPVHLIGQSAAEMVVDQGMAIVADPFETAWATRRAILRAIRFLGAGTPRWVRWRFELTSNAGRDEYMAVTRRTEPPAGGKADFSVTS